MTKNAAGTKAAQQADPQPLAKGRHRSAAAERAKDATPAERGRIASAPTLFKRACRLLLDHRGLFVAILLIYALLYLVLVGGASSDNLSVARSAIRSGDIGKLAGGVTLFSTLLISSGSNNVIASMDQSILLLIMSLAIIWTLRQVYAKHQIRARDAFYQGMYPLIPFLLVLLVVGLEFVPFAAGVWLYNTLVGGGIVVGLAEKGVVVVILLALSVASLYLACGAVMALYIVTLPDVTPSSALHSAGELVRGRRWLVLRKMLFLPLILLIVGAVLLVPVAYFSTQIATVLLLACAIVALAVAHSYMYTLYRELL